MDDQNSGDAADDVGVAEPVGGETGTPVNTGPSGQAARARDGGAGQSAAGQGEGMEAKGKRRPAAEQGGGMEAREERQAAVLRRQAGAALAVLGALLVGVVAFTTPWRALPAAAPAITPDPARDFTAAQLARSQAFDAATSLPGYLSLGLGLVFAGLLVATPLGARLVRWLRGPWWARVLQGVLVITVVEEALRWPIGIWFETVLREYGLSTQDWAGWTGDRLKGIGINAALLAVMVLAIVALARRISRWWIPAAAGAFALTVGASFVYPVVFEPVFNDFHAMPAGPLRTNLMAMAERGGVPVENVLVADASRRTTALNAYVSGFGATRRIVVFDTLLKAPQREVELVVAHELGHAKHRDVLYGTLVGAMAAALGAIMLFLVFGLVRRRTGLVSIADPRAVGVIMGLMTLATFLSGPLQNVLSRNVEARADAHALDLTRDPITFVAMQKRLASTNISDLSPDAVEYVLYASHPTTPQRIAMARSWAQLNGVPGP